MGKGLGIRTLALSLLTMSLVLLSGSSASALPEQRHFRGAGTDVAVFDEDVPDNNALLWTFTTGDQVQSTPIYFNKMVFFGSDDGNVYAVDSTWGTEEWRFETGESVMASPTITEDGVIYIGSSNYHFYALEAGTGEEIWSFELPSGYGQIPSTAVVDDHRVYFGSTNWDLYAINLTTHQEDWSFTAKNEIWSSPAVWDEYLYFGDLEGQMYCLWKENGTLVWNFSVDTFEGLYSSPAVADGKVIFGSARDDRGIYALDARTGALKWRYQSLGPNYGSPAVHDDVIYISAWGPPGIIFALPLDDPSPGDLVMEEENVIWSSEIRDEQGGSSAIYSKDRVLVGSDHGMGGDGRLFCFNATTGKEVWNFTTGGDVYSTPSLGAGVAYIGSNDGRVYAIGGDPNAKMEVKVVPEADTVQGGRVIGVSFLVTYRGLPLEGAFVKVAVTDGELSQSGASTFPDGTQRVKYQAPKVRSQTTVTFTAEVTFFGIENAVSTSDVLVIPASTYNVQSTETFNLKKYGLYIGLTVFLIVANVAIFAIGRRRKEDVRSGPGDQKGVKV